MPFNPNIANSDLGHGGLVYYKWAVVLLVAAQIPLAVWLSKTFSPASSYSSGSDDGAGWTAWLLLAVAIEITAVVFIFLGLSAAADRKKVDLMMEFEKLEKLEALAQDRSSQKQAASEK